MPVSTHQRRNHFICYLRHHCRYCGKVFCDECTRFRAKIPHMGIHDMVRICEYCRQEGVGLIGPASWQRDSEAKACEGCAKPFWGPMAKLTKYASFCLYLGGNTFEFFSFPQGDVFFLLPPKRRNLCSLRVHSVANSGSHIFCLCMHGRPCLHSTVPRSPFCPHEHSICIFCATLRTEASP